MNTRFSQEPHFTLLIPFACFARVLLEHKVQPRARGVFLSPLVSPFKYVAQFSKGCNKYLQEVCMFLLMAQASLKKTCCTLVIKHTCLNQGRSLVKMLHEGMLHAASVMESRSSFKTMQFSKKRSSFYFNEHCISQSKHNSLHMLFSEGMVQHPREDGLLHWKIRK